MSEDALTALTLRGLYAVECLIIGGSVLMWLLGSPDDQQRRTAAYQDIRVRRADRTTKRLLLTSNGAAGSARVRCRSSHPVVH